MHVCVFRGAERRPKDIPQQPPAAALAAPPILRMHHPPSCLQHVMYAIMLRSMGLGLTLRIPQFCERFISNIPAT